MLVDENGWLVPLAAQCGCFAALELGWSLVVRGVYR